MASQEDLHDVMQAIADQGLKAFTRLKEHPISLNVYFEKYFRLLKDLQELLSLISKNPFILSAMQVAYWQDFLGVLENSCKLWTEGKHHPIEDKRFRSESWVNNPFFNILSQQYLLLGTHFNHLLNNLPFEDPKVAKRVKFLSQQILDALSPDNFFHTNPELIEETIKSQGKNLFVGLQNFMKDLEKGPDKLVIKMTDKKAFQVGKNIASTPGKVIYKNNLIELIQYTPQTSKTHSVPLLMIPPWINKYYILDLSPNNSLVNYLVSQGITVFMISWVNPDASYRDYGLFDYLEKGPLQAIDIIKKQLAVKQVNLLGFCIGGTLQALLLGYCKAIHKNCIKSATFLASMIDFSDPGDIAVYIDEEQIHHLEQRMKSKGYLEGHVMANAFNSLRSSDLIWSFFIKNYLRGQTPVPFDILYWNTDSTNMPAKMHSEYLRDMYLNNELIKPGKIRLNEQSIDVHHITIPTFFVATIKDHIAPWQTIYLGYQLMKGEKDFILGESGHVNGIVFPPGSNKYGYYTNKVDSVVSFGAKEWLSHANYQEGSWWPYWMKWLSQHSGRLIKAPTFANLPYPGKYNAPGKYVFKQCGEHHD